MAWVRRQPCAARALPDATPCHGRIDPDHAGRRPGTSLKAADPTCIPMCRKHHRQRDNFHGMFRPWSGAQMRTWLDSVIDGTQTAYAKHRRT